MFTGVAHDQGGKGKNKAPCGQSQFARCKTRGKGKGFNAKNRGGGSGPSISGWMERAAALMVCVMHCARPGPYIIHPSFGVYCLHYTPFLTTYKSLESLEKL